MIKQKQNFKYFLFLFFFLCSVKGFAANYYWVGGSGNWSDINHWRTSSGGSGIPFVVPGLTDDVYFDANSGFTASSKTVTVNVPANMRNITFSGSAVAPVLNSASTANPINIYGSSEWQSGMTVNSVYLYYRNANIAKTIKSNGVPITGNDDVYFEDETSISLLDDFSAAGRLNHMAGTFNTNNHKVSVRSYAGNTGGKPRTVKSNGVPVNGSVFFEEETSVSLMDDLSVSSTITHSAGTLATLNHKVSMKNYSGDTGSKPRTLNLGSSDFYITGTMYDGDFSADSSYLTLNAGTSHIRFTGVLGYPKVKPYAGQHYYNISFEKAELEGNLGYVQSGKVYYNRITMNGNGKLIKDNEIKELILSEGKTYSLASSSTQTITGKLSAHIPDCGEKITISSSTAGTPANLVAASGFFAGY
ncbi:hypothetical protein [Chryseobacterium vrystaatense]|uniref:Uncharacterized protein n=1 Tax=Chryseobacterium vrystaatense TaxID=307480 RepID=A0ABR4UIQ9_9FLAO|nr:hypothetical protein [Chryseobacterium vrystaatense]KFF24586.1 hypothetical protein IW16_19920 [Chryseobacterium vrystaatense]